MMHVFVIFDAHTDERGDRQESLVAVAADLVAAEEAIASGKLPILHDAEVIRFQVLTRTAEPA